MDVKAIKVNYSDMPDIRSETVKQTESKSSVDGNKKEIHPQALVRELGEKHTGDTKLKPALNKSSHRNNDIAAKNNATVFESLALLSDVLSGEKNISRNSHEHFSKKILDGMWSPEKEHGLIKIINEHSDLLVNHLDKIADYYFNMLSHPDDMNSDLKEAVFGDKTIKFSSKSELILFLKTKLDAADFLKNMDSEKNFTDKTNLLFIFHEKLMTLPVMKDITGLMLSEKLESLKAGLDTLNKDAEIQDMARESLEMAQNLISAQGKSTTEYNNSLSVLMGKLADLRDSISQRKLENDKELAQLQQKMSQLKVDKDIAEIEEKVKKAERLQALFKWLGPLLTAVMALLTVLTGGLMAKALAAVIVIMTIVSEIVKAAGGPDIMAKVMEPVTKLVEVIQKFIKSIVMDIAKALGKSPEELKKLEKTMEIVAMVLAVVAVMALFMAVASAAGSITGKVGGQIVSEVTKETIKQAWVEIKAMLIRITLTSTIVNSASSVVQADLKADITRQRADLDLDLELLDRITELMNQIMATFSESQQELIALNEKISKSGKESFQRMKAILQQGPLAV